MTDTRFGTRNKFGTSTKFGASSGIDSSLVWGVEVDWDGDGIFTGASEAGYMCGLRVERGRRAMLKRMGDGIEVVATGKVVITLWNEDGRYDGWNASSPLYPNVTYGKDVRITIRDFATGAVEPVFYGVISDIVPTGYDEHPKVSIYTEDGWVFLRNYTASVTLRENVSPDAAIGLVLDDVGWPVRWGRNLESASSDNIRYFWADGNKLAGSAIEDISDSFFCYFYINASGQARFVNRINAGASVADFTQSLIYKTISNPQPWVNQRNVMKIKTHPRNVTGTVTLYQYIGAAIEIAAGASMTPIIANYTYNGASVPAYSVINPEETTDYTMNTNADGSGTDETANCPVTLSNFGAAGKIEAVNNSGGKVYVTSLNIRGVAVYETNVSDVTYPSNPSTVVQPKLFLMDLLWQQDVNQARDFINVLGPFFAGLHPFPAIEVESNFGYQFGIDLFDLVTLSSDRLGIGGVSFRVGGIEHETMDDNCQRVKTTFYLEPYIGGGTYMTWPGTWGTDTIFGW
jgi:hypothetical protein